MGKNTERIERLEELLARKNKIIEKSQEEINDNRKMINDLFDKIIELESDLILHRRGDSRSVSE